ncbi:MAG: site-specific integrase [Actinobacteria bacterium]|nr:site-specific integrase [Actinomycetota bacterium]
MSDSEPSRRRRVPGAANRNLYERTASTGEAVYEIGYRDADGRQRFETIGRKIGEARKARDEALVRRGRGEPTHSNPRLRFGEAADRWLVEQVADLRRQTRNGYRSAVEKHLRPRFGNRRLDRITVDDWALLVRQLRAAGLAESTIEGVLRVGRRVYKFAARRMGWYGVLTIALLEPSERPKVTARRKHRIYTPEQLAQTLAAAHEPYRTLFSFAAATGARVSECVGLVWADLDLRDPEAATVSIEFQVDRAGERQELKTEASRREVELPPSLARMLIAHRARSLHRRPGDFVFATASGKALGQRNVSRELRKAQRKAHDGDGRPTFPVLHRRDSEGKRMKVPRGAVPCFHSFRHTCASWAIADGDGAEEVSWQLGHKDSIVTRKVYIAEVRSAERTARRRGRMEARYGDLFEGLVPEARGPAEDRPGRRERDRHGGRRHPRGRRRGGLEASIGTPSTEGGQTRRAAA